MTTFKDFPFDIRDIEENEKKELHEYSLDLFSYIRIGPKNYMLLDAYKHDAANIYNMPLKPDDVFVISYPRSGTTWTQELVWLLVNDLDYEKAFGMPLQVRYIFLEQSMFAVKEMINHMRKENVNDVEKQKLIDLLSTPGSIRASNATSPRFIKTHLPISLLPPSLLDNTKVVYVARDPRDVAVSYYHHGMLFNITKSDGEFKKFWSLYHRDMQPWSPFFEHLKEAWNMRHHPNMLFLFYEELTKDLPATVRRTADFFGKKLTEEQIAGLCKHLSFENFKNNASVNMDEMKSLGMMSTRESFVRKGKSGGWRDYFDEEMSREAELWMEENLRDTDLRFPHIQ